MLVITPFSEIKKGDQYFYSLKRNSDTFTVKTVIKTNDRVWDLYDEIFAKA